MNRLLLALVAFVCLSSCGSLAVTATPEEIKHVPGRQSLLLEVVIEKIAQGDAAWVTEEGGVIRDVIVRILQADKAAWDELDRFYNGAPDAPAPEPEPAPVSE